METRSFRRLMPFMLVWCVGCVITPAVTWSESDPPTKGRYGALGDHLTVQIAGRFCEYERDDVKVALGDVWSVDAVEFVNDQGTLSVYFDRRTKAPSDVAQELERALSFGWFCTAQVHESGQERLPLIGLLEVRR